MSAVTITSFRGHYPEFADLVRYSDSQVGYYLDLAGKLLNARRFNTLLDVATELFIAHNIVLEARAQAEAASGGIPGMATGIISSKSVDKVSINYDTTGALETGAGHWNLTIYGTRLAKLLRMFGAGPIQVGVGCTPPLNGPAWPGPQNQTSF